MIVLLGLHACIVHAADGDPDPSFGIGGAAAFPVDDPQLTNDIGFAVHELPDGKVLGFIRVATVSPAGLQDLLIVRLLANGDPDLTFGNGGRVSINLGYFGLTDAVVDDQGRMLIAGSKPFGATSFSSLLRLLPDGNPDNSFSSDGFSGIDWNGVFDGPLRLRLASDGSIWMTGSLGDPAVNQDLYVAKFNSENGALIFGSYLRIDRTTNGRDFGTGLFEDSSGRMLVLGSSCFSSLACDGVVMRLFSSGVLDTSFAAAQTPRCRYNQVGSPTTGCGLFGLFGARELFNDGIELATGELLLAGRSQQDGESTRGLLIASESNGSALVPSNEIQRRSGPFGTDFRNVAFDSQGRVLVAGGGGAMRVVDLASGGFDPSFSSGSADGGRLALPPRFEDIGPSIFGASFNDRDQIYLAGSLYRADNNQRDGYVARLKPDVSSDDVIFAGGFD